MVSLSSWGSEISLFCLPIQGQRFAGQRFEPFTPQSLVRHCHLKATVITFIHSYAQLDPTENNGFENLLVDGLKIFYRMAQTFPGNSLAHIWNLSLLGHEGPFIHSYAQLHSTEKKKAVENLLADGLKIFE